MKSLLKRSFLSLLLLLLLFSGSSSAIIATASDPGHTVAQVEPQRRSSCLCYLTMSQDISGAITERPVSQPIPSAVPLLGGGGT